MSNTWHTPEGIDVQRRYEAADASDNALRDLLRDE